MAPRMSFSLACDHRVCRLAAAAAEAAAAAAAAAAAEAAVRTTHLRCLQHQVGCHPAALLPRRARDGQLQPSRQS